MADLKQTFIQKCLTEYMQETIATIKIAATRAGVGVTGDAVKSLSYQIMQLQAGGTASLSFNEYLRMIDMGVGRAHPLGGLTTMKKTLQQSRAEGYSQVKDKTRKPKKIYSRIAYGKLSSLQGKLLHGYTSETIAMIKNEMEQKNTTI